MDLRPSEDQRHLVESFARLYASSAPVEAVQAAERNTPAGHDPGLWRRLAETGAVAMAVPEERGGFGASLLDLALVAEQHGRPVAPAPLVEAQVAARLLARLGEVEADVQDGARVVTLAVRPAVDGVAGLIPAGAVADRAIVLDGERLLLVPCADARPVDTLGKLPVADLTMADGTVLAEGAQAVALFDDAVDEWRILTAAALQGLAARALEIGVAYVKQRQAFGRTIGGFQAVAHALADRVTEVEGCELLVREAAWAAAEDPERVPELAAMALAFATETARDATRDALHFHGGYGFMLEYPIQLFHRRARTWGLVLESPAAGLRLAARRAARREREQEAA